jgi:glycerol-3-phosphate dehydrogenase (NAD(P)+)
MGVWMIPITHFIFYVFRILISNIFVAMKIGVIGSGSWGTALVKVLNDNGCRVVWCVRSERMAHHIRTRHHNPKYLSSVYFSDNLLDVVYTPAEVYEQADAILIAVPSAYVDEYTTPYLDVIGKGKLIISATKGILPQHNLLLNHQLKSKIDFDIQNYVAIMGPCHAEEVAAERLSYLTFAGTNEALTKEVASFFSTPYINTIISNDVDGVQYAAVLKNVYAIGTGIAHGLGYGDNFQSVFVANAAGEMKKFLRAANTSSTGINYSASVYLGDLLVTCYSLFSRNRSFGNMIGKGYSVEAAKLAMQMVAEGYPAAKSIHELSISCAAHTPIASGIYDILWEKKDAAIIFAELEKVLV